MVRYTTKVHLSMKFSDYVRSLTPAELESYAARCGTSAAYIGTHLLHARKEPRKRLRLALSAQSEGKVSISEVLEHFGMGDAPDVEKSSAA